MTLFPTITAQHWRDYFRRCRANPSNTVAERIRQKLSMSTTEKNNDTLTSVSWPRVGLTPAEVAGLAERSTPTVETKLSTSGPSVPGPDTLAELYRVNREVNAATGNEYCVDVSASVKSGDSLIDGTAAPVVQYSVYVRNSAFERIALATGTTPDAAKDKALAEFGSVLDRKADKIAKLRAELAKLEGAQ